jgi:hypothetical protein
MLPHSKINTQCPTSAAMHVFHLPLAGVEHEGVLRQQLPQNRILLQKKIKKTIHRSFYAEK